MAPKSSSGSALKQAKLSFASSKPNAATGKSLKPAVLTYTRKTEVKEVVDIESSSNGEEDSLDDIQVPTSASEREDDTIEEHSDPEPKAQGRVLRSATKASATPKTVRRPVATRELPVTDRSTKTVSAAAAEKVPEEGLANIESIPHLNVKDAAYTEIYRATREKMGYAHTIHGNVEGQKQNRIHEILRVFDLSYEYGPAIGMTRLERWQRASSLGLKPPKEVYDILTTREGITDPSYVENVFVGQV